MTEVIAEKGGGRQLLRRISTHPGVPAAVRSAVARVEGSPLGYRLAHGAFWSLTGSALSRALTLAASVVTARILGKEGFGELGVVNSTLLTFQAFAGLGLAMTNTKYVAELRASDPARAGRIVALSTVVSTWTGALSTALLWVFAPWLATHAINAPQLTGLLRIAALGLVFVTLSGAQSGALAGLEAFRAATRLNVWSGLLGVPIAVAGVWSWGLEGAVWAAVAQAALQWGLTQFAVRAEARRQGIPIGPGGWRQELGVLWTFSLPAVVQGIMVTPVSWAAAAILVNRPGGYAEMGAFSAANHWFALALFVPTALGGPVLPVLSERIGRRDVAGTRKVLLAALAMNVVVVTPIVLAGSLASRWIMGMYGPSFGGAWPTLVVVLVTAGLVAATNPVGAVLAASGRLWLGFLMNSGWAALLLGTTVLLARWGSLGIATARLVAYAVHAIWTAWFALRYVGKAMRSNAPRRAESSDDDLSSRSEDAREG